MARVLLLIATITPLITCQYVTNSNIRRQFCGRPESLAFAAAIAIPEPAGQLSMLLLSRSVSGVDSFVVVTNVTFDEDMYRASNSFVMPVRPADRFDYFFYDFGQSALLAVSTRLSNNNSQSQNFRLTIDFRLNSYTSVLTSRDATNIFATIQSSEPLASRRVLSLTSRGAAQGRTIFKVLASDANGTVSIVTYASQGATVTNRSLIAIADQERAVGFIDSLSVTILFKNTISGGITTGAPVTFDETTDQMTIGSKYFLVHDMIGCAPVPCFNDGISGTYDWFGQTKLLINSWSFNLNQPGQGLDYDSQLSITRDFYVFYGPRYIPIRLRHRNGTFLIADGVNVDIALNNGTQRLERVASDAVRFARLQNNFVFFSVLPIPDVPFEVDSTSICYRFRAFGDGGPRPDIVTAFPPNADDFVTFNGVQVPLQRFFGVDLFQDFPRELTTVRHIHGIHQNRFLYVFIHNHYRRLPLSLFQVNNHLFGGGVEARISDRRCFAEFIGCPRAVLPAGQVTDARPGHFPCQGTVRESWSADGFSEPSEFVLTTLLFAAIVVVVFLVVVLALALAIRAWRSRASGQSASLTMSLDAGGKKIKTTKYSKSSETKTDQDGSVSKKDKSGALKKDDKVVAQ